MLPLTKTKQQIELLDALNFIFFFSSAFRADVMKKKDSNYFSEMFFRLWYGRSIRFESTCCIDSRLWRRWKLRREKFDDDTTFFSEKTQTCQRNDRLMEQYFYVTCKSIKYRCIEKLRKLGKEKEIVTELTWKFKFVILPWKFFFKTKSV